jgi:L-threonylcarbamoyladenylate synthase
MFDIIMDTKILSTGEQDIEEAAGIIMKGGVVVFPTETVYGIGADAFNDSAVKKIYKIKGRPNDNPMIVHIASVNHLMMVADEIPEVAYNLAQKYWPGPLTIVLKKNQMISKTATAKLKTVAIRCPNNKVAQNLIEMSSPIAAPSANISGEPSATREKHVVNELSGKVDAIIKGGDVSVGLESTVLDLTTEPYTLLRPGKVTFEELKEFLGEDKVVLVDEKDSKKPKSPGLKYKHYSPKAKIIICDEGEVEKCIKNNKFDSEIIVIAKKQVMDVEIVRKTFAYQGKEELAKNMFSWFRKVDSMGVKTIIFESVEESGLGMAIMDRVRKAAGK